MRRCVVTGGAGFIGSHLVRGALDQGYQVVVLDNLSTGRIENLARVIDHIEFVRGDIRDRGVLAKVMPGTELVFHEAALAEVPVSIENPVLSAEINDIGTLNVFEAAARAGVNRLVFASSSAVYGDGYRPPHHEKLTPNPDSPYAAHKLLGEQYGVIYGRLFNLETVSLRYFNVFGPNQAASSPYSGVISCFLDSIVHKRRPIIYGDGGQSRDFIFVKDVVEANFLAAGSPKAPGAAVNIGAGGSITLLQTLEVLSRLTGQEIIPEFRPSRPGDVYESKADISLAGEILGFTPKTPFETGLSATWEWFLKENA